MSATTEKLLTEIQLLELQLLDARNSNDPVRIMHVENQLVDAKKRLNKANEVLHEGRTVLKG